MTSQLTNIEDLKLFKCTGLKEIAKYNKLFKYYWNDNRKHILNNFDDILKNNITVLIPDLDEKYYKKLYVGDDKRYQNKVCKKDDPNYQQNRHQRLIQITKDRYKNDQIFQNKMKETSKNYYHNLKKIKKEYEEIKKMI
jgi:hypothetical protein